MNILVTGANGQLGHEVQDAAKWHKDDNWFFSDINVENPLYNLDITNEESTLNFVKAHNIDIIINCAAYTNVDKAEENEELATLINVTGIKNLGKAAATVGAKVLHISTDYVYGGDKNTPYAEEDIAQPNTAYGKTKLAGEIALKEVLPNDYIIIRTAWLYSKYANNFVKTMIKLGREKDQLTVVYDQVGSPTYAYDLANVIVKVIKNWHTGTYNYANEGAISWYDFTKAIHKIAKVNTNIIDYPHFGKYCNVLPILSSEYKYKTPRPSYSVLNKSKIKETFNVIIPYWEESLYYCIQKIMIDEEIENEKKMFVNSIYEGMSFERLDEWNELKRGFTSPRYLMSNGDTVAIDVTGTIVKIEKK